MGIKIVTPKNTTVKATKASLTHMEKMISMFVDSKDTVVGTVHEFAKNQIEPLENSVIKTFYTQLTEVNILLEKILSGNAIKVAAEIDPKTLETITPQENYTIPATQDELKQIAWDISLRDYGNKFTNILDSDLATFQSQFDSFVDQIVTANKDFATYKSYFE